jgi:hypothetical protein
MFTVAAFLTIAPTLSAQASALPADIDRLVGPTWTGTLTYRDYSNGARTSIKAALRVSRLPVASGAPAQWDMRIAYADEPHANSGDTISLSADGRRFRGQAVVERRVLADGQIEIVTEADGRDDDRPARIRSELRIGERNVSLRKLVRYEGGEFFERHIYEWKL